MKFEEAVNRQLCEIKETLKKTLLIKESEYKTANDIVFITIPEDATPSAGTRSFAIGTTKIDFRTGVITNPDGTLEYLNTKLNTYKMQWLHSVSIDANQPITIKLDGKPKRMIAANFSTQIPYLTYYTLEITCTVATDIQVFACTNPAAVIGQFKVTTVSILEQESINGDTVENQTWDTVLNLKNNLNRIRKKLNDIIGGTLWSDTVSGSLSTIWGKFNATTGHKHTGAANDAPNLAQTGVAGDATEANTWDAITTLQNNLNRIRNQITGITGEAWGTVSHSIAAVWAKFHATTGHAHSGAADDGAQIDHVNVANKGTNTHAQIDTAITNSANHIAATAAHGSSGNVVGQTTLDTHAALAASVHGVSASGFEDKANKAAASGYPSLNASSKVVQDPANATATPTASKIPIADGSGKLDGWITTTAFEQTANKNAVSGYVGLDVNSDLYVPGCVAPASIEKAASATIRNSHDAETSTTSTTYVKLKTITLSKGIKGVIRVLFDLYLFYSPPPFYSVYGRVYKNGVAIGAEQSTASNTYMTKSEDITLDCSPGDTIELWGKVQAYTGRYQNFRLAYDNSDLIVVASANS